MNQTHWSPTAVTRTADEGGSQTDTGNVGTSTKIRYASASLASLRSPPPPSHTSVIVTHRDLPSVAPSAAVVHTQQPLDLFAPFWDTTANALFQYPQQWYSPSWPAAAAASAEPFYQPYEATASYPNTPSTDASRPSSIADILSPIQHQQQHPPHYHHQTQQPVYQHFHHHQQQQQHPIMPSHIQPNVYGASVGGQYRIISGGTHKRRGQGGRRPREDDSDQYLTGEEMEKKMKRRLRNKEAAARCRQRRLDLMNELSNQVDALKEENRHKDVEIRRLIQQKNELEYILGNHDCKKPPTSLASTAADYTESDSEHVFTMPGAGRQTKRSVLGVHHQQQRLQPHNASVKPEPEQMELTLSQVAVSKDNDLQRPTSLFCGGGLPVSSSGMSLLLEGGNNVAGVSITTPSNGLPSAGVMSGGGFANFELLGQSTGLTPVNNTGLTPLFPITTSSAVMLETPMMESGKRSLESL